MTDPTTTPTPAETRQGARERAARALYEHRQDAEAAPQDGYTAWDDLPEEWQDEYREAADAALAAASTAAPDEREALDVERLPERFRFSREVYGDVADDATRVLLALTDGGHADQPSDHLRWVSITAAQALAARPAPVVSGDVRVEWGARIEVGEHFGNVTPLPSEEAAREWVAFLNQDGNKPLRTLVRRTVTDWTVADAPAADDEGGRE